MQLRRFYCSSFSHFISKLKKLANDSSFDVKENQIDPQLKENLNEIHLTFTKKNVSNSVKVLTECKVENSSNLPNKIANEEVWILVNINWKSEMYIDFQIMKVIPKKRCAYPHIWNEAYLSESSEETEFTLDGLDHNWINIKAESDKEDFKSINFRSDSDYDINDVYRMKSVLNTEVWDKDNLQYIQPQLDNKKNEDSWIDILDLNNSQIKVNTGIVKLSSEEIVNELKKLKK